MGEFLSYSIVSGLLLLSMFLVYKMLLAGENQHNYNRGVLLMIYVVAFATLPLISAVQTITAPTPVTVDAAYSIEIAETMIPPIARPIWGTVLIWIFMTGMALVAVRTLITWVRLMAVIRSGEKIRHNGYTLVLTDDERLAPFSWMQYIVMSRSDYKDNSPAIAAHEMEHIACRHWLDLLVAQVACIVNWFNPAVWLMRDELMLVHEYQADMAVIDCGHDPQQYQMLLIKKAVGARFPSLANSLNHSKLKKRITMMYKEKSGAGRRLKALALVPMLALALGVAGVPAVRAAVSTISSSEVSIGKDNENPPQKETDAQNFKVSHLINDTVVITGDPSRSAITIKSDPSASLDNMEIYFDGVKIGKAEMKAISPDKIASITVDKKSNLIKISTDKLSETSADIMPKYPGGETAMMQAIMGKVTFPNPDRKWKSDASGQTVVGFTVGTDGRMTDFKIMRSCGFSDLDNLAIKAVKDALTEKWTPGTTNGKPVAVSYAIPIRYKQKK